MSQVIDKTQAFVFFSYFCYTFNRGDSMKKLVKFFIALIIIICCIVTIINLYMLAMVYNKIININSVSQDNYNCILVLGAGIRNNEPSPMLEDRLKTAIKLYQKGISKKILVSGDHEFESHDEVNIMKKYLVDAGIPSSDVFMDHAGLSTYDSIYRAKHIFGANKVIIVTQKYHLFRALYIAKKLDVSSRGISADERIYIGQSKRNIREIAARVKDFIKCIIMPTSTYLGERVSLEGNGDITNDN